MNKQTKNITSAKKVSLKEYKISAKKTYHISKSDKEHTAYVVKCENYNDIPLELSGAKYEDTNISSARVVDDNDQLNTFVSKGSFDIEEVNIPAGTDRDAFLKKWFKIATKKKTNLLPLLLLPLTACGGAKDVTAPVVAKPVGPVVTEKSTGVWEVGSNNGTIAVTKNTGNTEFTFTPTTGTAVDVAISGVNELQIPTGVSVNADAAVVSGKTINGAGTINITNVEDDLDVDLSTITTTNVNATVDSATSIVFGATSHFGDAVVTLTGNTSSTADVITFHSSANLSSATFVVSTGATLGLSLVQAAAISATATITGTGNVVITMPEDTVDNTETALVKIDLEGGSLTFDQGTDDNDILVLKAGSSIDLAGGDLIIDDGIVDFSTNSIIPTNLGSLIMNSGLMMDASVFLNNVSGKISGKGNLILEVSGVDEITALDAKMASYIDSSLDVPILAVNVGDVSSLNSTQIAELNTALINLAPKLSTVTGKNVAIKDSTGQSIEQFTATVSGGQVKFAGEQKGDISVNVNADGSATFSRGSVKSDTKVTDLSAVDLDVPTSTNLDISLSGNSSQNLFEVNAQNATVIKLKGNIDGADEITVRINDANSSSLDTKDITIDTTGLSGTGSLVFEFDTTAKNVGKDDTVVLSSSSVISSSIGALEVVNGHLDITKAQIPTGLEVTTASGITMTTAQFISAASFTSLPGSGELTIVADNSTDVASLNNFLTASDTTMTIIGHAITITTDSGDVALSGLSGGYATLKTNLEAISYPGIPQLSDAVTSNDSNISTNLSNLNILTAKVGSITTDNDSTTSTVAVEINAMQDKLLGITGTVVSAIDTDVEALESQLKGTGWNSSNDYANLKTVSDALDALTTNLTTLDTLVGTITDNGGSKTSTVSTELNLLQANVGSLTSTVAEKIAAAVSDLKGTGWDSSNDYANLKTVSDAIDRLDNLVGSITTSNDSTASTVEAEINAIQDQLVGITSVADTVKKVALIPTLSVQGSHLNDSTLHANEGDITIRVSLPSVVAADDVVHLYLGGVAFTSAKTDTLDSTDISNTYVDFVVTQSQLGSAGAKALSAKIVSGSVTSDTSASLYFDLSSASTAPTVKSNGISITSATGISGSVLDTGDVVSMAVVFSETVLVTGSPTLTITIGSTDKTATYSSGAGTDTLYFKYTIQSDDGNDEGGISIPANAITASGSNGITDISGNTATITHTAVLDNSSYKVTIDSVGPSSPLIYNIEGDNYINAAEKTDGVFVAGTTEANATVSIAWGGDTRSVTADAGGDWYAYYGAGDSTIVSGTITVTPTDEAGNTGSAATASVIVDSTAPAAVASIALASDTGSSGSDGITSSGTVNVSLNEGTAWQYMVNNGGWVDGSNTSFVLIGDGSKSIKVREIDAAGNVGPSSTLSATLDTSASVGTLSVKNISNGTGSPITTSDTDFNLELSSAEASSTTAYQYKYTNLSDVVVTNWTTTSTQPTIGKDGKYEFRANVTDAAGNTSTSNTVTVNVSATGPTLSSSSITQSDDSSVNSIGETYVLNLTFDKIVNGLTSGTDSTVWRDGDSGVSATWAGSNGTTTRTLTYTLAAGDTGAVTINETNLETVLAAGITDGSGNAFSDSISEIDSGGLDDADGVVPTVTITDDQAGTSSDSDNTVLYSFAFSEDVTGFSADDVTVTGGVKGAFASTNASNYTLEVTAADASTTDIAVTVVAAGFTDLAGNKIASDANAAAQVVDTVNPSVTVGSIDISADTGSDATDFNTKTASQTITATLSTGLVTGEELYGSVDNGTNWIDITGKVSGTAITWNGATLSGSSTILLEVRDSVGNAGSRESQSYVLDTGSPSVTVGSIDISADTGSSATDFNTKTASQTITATLSTGLVTGEELYGSVDNGTNWIDITNKVSGTDITWNGATLSGSSTILLEVRDLAGNAGSRESQSYVLDTTGPSFTVGSVDISADTGSSATDFNTKTASQTITATLSGNLGAHDILYGSVDNGTNWIDITNKVSGTDITWDGATLSGSSNITFKVGDLAGNTETSNTGTTAYVLDTGSPSVTVGSIDISADTGSSATDFNTKTASQTITATLSTGLVTGEELYGSVDNGTNWIDITNKVSGTDITWNGATLSGSSTILLEVRDLAGNAGSRESQSYVLDTTGPSFTVGSVDISADTGSSATDFNTKTASQTITATLSGNLGAHDILYGSVDNGTNWIDITNKVSGTDITWDGATLSGSSNITFKVGDLAGNTETSNTGTTAYVLDTGSPSVTVGSIDISADTGSSATDFNTKTASQTITATLSTGLVTGEELYGSVDNGTNWIDITNKVSGTDITWNGATLSGSSTILLEVRDLAGNAGSRESQSYVLDTTGPSFTVGSVDISADTGSDATDFNTKTASQTITATLSGNLGAHDILYGSVDNGTNWIDITDKVSRTDITWDGATLSGSSNITFKVGDLAGNTETSNTGTTAYVLDTGSPSVTVGSIDISADTGSSATDFNTKTASQTITATLSTGLVTGEELYGSVDNGTNWIDITNKVSGTDITWNGATLSGSSTILLEVRDLAGNAGSRESQSYVLDTGSPSVTVGSIDISADTGSSATDFNTKTASQTITATLSTGLVTGEELYGSVDNGTNWIDITGKVSGTDITWNGATLSGSSTILLEVRDLAGNAGSRESQSYVLDTTGPSFTVGSVDISADTGSDATDFNTKTASQTITATLSGNLGAHDILYGSVDNGTNWIDITNKVSGTDITWDGATLSGSSNITFKVGDLAGNTETSNTGTTAYVLDTGSPSVTVGSIDISADTGSDATDFNTKTASQTITATLSTGLVTGEELYGSVDNGTNWIDITDKVSGTDITWNGATLSGSSTILLEVRDLAGNAGSRESQSYVLDTGSPSVTVGSIDISADTGSSATDFNTKTASQTITATLSTGLVTGEELYGSVDNGTNWIDITDKVSGTDITWNGATLSGSSTILLEVRDLAGNAGSRESQSYVLDTTGPSFTVGSVDISADTGSDATDFNTKTASQTITATLSGNLGAHDILYGSVDNGTNWIDITNKVSGTDITWDGATLSGSSNITFKVGDLAGNTETSNTGTTAYVLDTGSPSVTVGSIDISADTGSDATDFNTKTASQTITATLSTGLVTGEELYGSVDNGTNWIDITNKVSGTDITWNGATLSGSSTILLEVRDLAGNAGSRESQSYVLDTVNPSVTVGSIDISADTGSSATDFNTKTASQTITATLSTGLVTGEELYGSVDNGTNWIDITGKVSGTDITWNGATLSGSSTILLEVRDSVGNAGSRESQSYVLDTGSPSVTVGSIDISADTGSSATDFNTKTASQTITATLSTGLVTGEELYGSVDSGTNWIDITNKVSGTDITWDGATLSGSSTILLEVRDLAGNAGSRESQSYVLDTTGPSFTVGSVDISADTGSDATDFNTKTASQTITATLSGNLGAHDILYGSVDNGTNWIDITNKVSGTDITWDGATLSGSSNITFKVGDLAGNTETSNTGTTAYVLDTGSPSVTVGSIDISADTGSDATDFNTKTASQTITATLSTGLVTGEELYGSVDNGTNWIDITNKVSGTDITWNGATLSGSSTILLEVRDLAGNAGSRESQSYVLDTGSPSVTVGSIDISADTGSSATDFNTKTASQTITATLSTGLVTGEELYGSVDNGTNWIDITDKVSGTDITWNGATLSGSSTILLEVRDLAGNAGSRESQSYVLDTTGPSFTVGSVDISADTGSDATDFNTKTASQTITATLSGNLGAHDILYGSVDNGTNWIDITNKVSGTDITWDGATLSGSSNITFKVGDLAGNTETSNTGTTAYVLDTGSPSVTVGSIDISADTGSSATDFNTKTASQTITATLSTGLVTGEELYGSVDNGTNWIDITNKVSGTDITWNGATLSGSSTILLEVRDLAGNAGSRESQSYVLDTTGPSFTVGSVDISADTGSDATDFNTKTASQTITATLSGNLGAHDILYGSVDNGTNWIDITNKVSGTDITWDGATLSGSSNITFKVGDLAGNTETSNTGTTAYVLDTGSPSVTVGSIDISADTGSSATDFNTKTASQTITATLSTGLVTGEELYGSVDNGTNWIDITNKVSGTDITWNGATLSGSSTILLEVRDLAGNAGSRESQSYVLDTGSPSVTVGSIDISADTGSSATDFNTKTASQTITATLSTGLVTGEELYGSVDNGTNWIDITNKVSGTDITWNGATLSGSSTILLEVRDLAGNAGSRESQSYVLDTTGPSFTVGSVDISADTGSDATDFNTKTASQTITATLSGNLGAHDILYGSVDNGTNWIDITNKVSGTDITWDGATLSGSSNITFKVGDLAGNTETSNTGTTAYVLDTGAPLAPSIDVLTASDTGTNTSDNISADSTPQIRVTFSGANAAVGDTVTLYAGSSSVATATLSSTGILNGITLTPSSAIGADGTYSLTAVITDVAGNVGASSSAISYQLDTSNSAPTASVVAVSGSGFTLLASDGDVQPDWNVITLDSGSVTLNSSALNNGSNTTFTIGEQSVLSSNELLVNDGVASAVAVNSGSTAVKLNAGTEFNENIGGTDSKANITYGFGGEDNITGKGEADFLFGGAGGDTLRARGGDDTLSGGTGADTFVFESSGNGLDTITDFDDTQSDVLDLDAIITGGLYNSGTAVDATANNAIDLANVDNKFVYFEVSDVSSATINETSLFGGSLDFAAEGTSAIEFVLAVGEGSGTDGVKLYQVNDGTGSNDMAITQIALIENNSLADILNANLDVA